MTFEDMYESLDMNDDLISRKYLKMLIDYACSWPSETDGIAHAIYTWANKIVDECPSVDLKADFERPKGEWIKREEIFDDEGTPRLVWGCKDCGFSLKSIHDKRNYCPNCGAKMKVKGGK